MLNIVAKILLVLSALSPVLGGVAISQFAKGLAWTVWAPWLGVAILLVVVCVLLLRYAAKNAQKHSFTITEFESKDMETIVFLLAYLIPFVSADSIMFTDEWMTGVYIFAIIFLVIVHAGAFHFNPVMGLLGYHFYSVKNIDGISYLLISKREIRRPGESIQTVQLANNINLSLGGQNAT
ncbi:MAG TPA: hypothetical protein PLK36_03500 [Methanoregulaceae archaeon]|nr:hypothetical protein [Methanoregulaceae archaeon]HQN89120.1 hypothetical protein [Methanoregulaceae archaeon]HQP83109.1 hypothetical protein [Methanoregulaceae archaeon]